MIRSELRARVRRSAQPARRPAYRPPGSYLALGPDLTQPSAVRARLRRSSRHGLAFRSSIRSHCRPDHSGHTDGSTCSSPSPPRELQVGRNQMLNGSSHHPLPEERRQRKDRLVTRRATKVNFDRKTCLIRIFLQQHRANGSGTVATRQDRKHGLLRKQLSGRVRRKWPLAAHKNRAGPAWQVRLSFLGLGSPRPTGQVPTPSRFTADRMFQRTEIIPQRAATSPERPRLSSGPGPPE